MPDFRILVLSDLHMHQGNPNEGGAPSYLSSHPDFAGPRQNPIQDAIELFQDSGLTADWILCPGDIADKNDLVSARIAWSNLDELKRKLHARKLIGTVGNHDVDSRRENAANRPDDSLKNLRPLFPLSEQKFSDRFWANHYVVWKDSRRQATLVVLNTCVLHGVAVPPGGDPEHLRGYVTEAVLAHLRAQLPDKLSRFNVLMMHHHIRQHPWLIGDNSHAINGPLLVDLLKETGVPWLVIHGHQHLPNLGYSDPDANSPVILSAGSIAAKTYAVRGQTPRNQMHLIEFDEAAAEADLINKRGRIQTWNWTPAVGWTDAFRDSGLPRKTGFGHRGDLNQLAQSILGAIQGTASKRLRWEDLLSLISEPQFLVPADMDQLVQNLEAQGVVVDYDRWQVPSVVAI